MAKPISKTVYSFLIQNSVVTLGFEIILPSKSSEHEAVAEAKKLFENNKHAVLRVDDDRYLNLYINPDGINVYQIVSRKPWTPQT